VLGDTAVVTARNNTSGAHQGHPLPEAVRATLVLVSDSGNWRLAAIRMSFIAGTRGAPPIPRGQQPPRRRRKCRMRTANDPVTPDSWQLTRLRRCHRHRPDSRCTTAQDGPAGPRGRGRISPVMLRHSRPFRSRRLPRRPNDRVKLTPDGNGDPRAGQAPERRGIRTRLRLLRGSRNLPGGAPLRASTEAGA
jgi:hypothetical protein